ncbi:unnamed protein product [Rangifer tarandus platyrhynchus]|uniref:Uncharacterized protein n=2 Tax=Rangifer tarandus platyrhynchus TaxID=3082113 RepID=A0ACB0FB60_RANTA|nr:unnamed protein product [Rangifer tarandus platyrhynchus]CAI9709944.1 unnamed protein product [Rangifer tarandus platyrhynchus]
MKWPALFSCPHTDTGSFCVQESRAEELWQEGFCSSLPVELHGSTISQLEEDRREDKCRTADCGFGAGLPLLEGTLHHRFLFSRNRLQRFVAFQTAAGAGQRHRFGSELLATARRLAVRPRQAGQHRSRSLRFRADAVPFWKGSGGSQWTAPQQIWGKRSWFEGKRSGGAGPREQRARFHGTEAAEAAGAAGPLGSQVSSRSRRSKGAHLCGPSATQAFRPRAPRRRRCLVGPSCCRALRRETHLAGPASPAHQLLPRELNFCTGLGLAEPEWRAARSRGGGWSRSTPRR